MRSNFGITLYSSILDMVIRDGGLNGSGELVRISRPVSSPGLSTQLRLQRVLKWRKAKVGNIPLPCSTHSPWDAVIQQSDYCPEEREASRRIQEGRVMIFE